MHPGAGQWKDGIPEQDGTWEQEALQSEMVRPQGLRAEVLPLSQGSEATSRRDKAWFLVQAVKAEVFGCLWAGHTPKDLPTHG